MWKLSNLARFGAEDGNGTDKWYSGTDKTQSGAWGNLAIHDGWSVWHRL